ncbi:MAG: hypothetical protein KGS72_26400 [Cyanobacteria bacterium REEB67]|nr:hypothetical protein [Cyanobacteria bacterium REEB67]
MTASNKTARSSAKTNKPLVREIFGFDLQTIVEKHPEHKALIDWLCHGAQPQYTYGMISTACFLKSYQERSKKRRPEEIGGLWAFTGESNRQRDVRISEDQRTEMLIHAEEYAGGCSDDLLRLLYELRPAYFRVAYDADNKAISRVRSSQYIKDSETAKASFEQLIAARNSLQGRLNATYAETATIATRTNPKQPRFSVRLRKNGLIVMVLLTDAEDNRGKGAVAGEPFAQYVSQIPAVWESCEVKVDQWTLDRSATED